jgi:hypothetical protein
MSLSDRIAELTPLVFTDTERFGEEIYWIPASEYLDRELVDAVAEQENLRGTNENPGDGITLNRPAERSERRSVTVFCSLDVPVRHAQPQHSPDAFEIDGEIYAVKRILRKDFGGQHVLCVRKDTTLLRNYVKTG